MAFGSATKYGDRAADLSLRFINVGPSAPGAQLRFTLCALSSVQRGHAPKKSPESPGFF